MKIVVEGASKSDGSYGIVNTNLAAALCSLGADVVISPWDQPEDACRDQLGDELQCPGLPVSNDASMRADVRIRQIWPPVWAEPPDGARLVVIQPWEYGPVPIEWTEGARHADAIWVPSS